ncbi:MAG: DUF805 domain-containing protein [Roseinatronobacter sp.]
MTFITAITRGFAGALTFSGRSRRPDYWWFFLFVFAGAFLFSAIDLVLFGEGSIILTRIFQLVVLVPFLAVAWRRLQDTGKPGWWIVPPSGLVVLSALIAGSVGRRVLAGLDSGAAALDVISPAAGGLLLVLSLVQVAAGLLIVWWMSRPSQKGPNAYGPEPRVRARN